MFDHILKEYDIKRRDLERENGNKIIIKFFAFVNLNFLSFTIIKRILRRKWKDLAIRWQKNCLVVLIV